ncbi:MAG TPA: aldo/keto reductase [Acidimicrobiia bacterium]|jgi:aryl-alcohol dehydrogenase-like predicted oxidoreductase
MQRRRLGSTGFDVSEVGFGGWAIGADWGSVSNEDAIAAIHAAIDEGVDFFDTADVYGDGLSERRLAQVRDERTDARMTIATKAGRRLDPHVADGYTPTNIEAFVDRSLKNLATESLDLLQLHCPPTDVYYRPELFAGLDELVTEGKIRHYGVSVERVEEALKAIEYPGVETVQIIFNVLRQRPAELFFSEATRRDVGVIVRVPLASGLLTGKLTAASTFGDDDHRAYNRHGEAFDVGETFSGIPFETGLAAVEELRELVPDGATMAQLAIRWILMHPAVSTVIPGAKRPSQAIENARAALLPPLDDATMALIADVYDRRARAEVHHRW